MNKKIFTTEEILRALIPECYRWYEEQGRDFPDEGAVNMFIVDMVYEADFVCSDEFENIMELVFEHEGKHWKCFFETNDGAGYNDFWGISHVGGPSGKRIFSLQKDGTWLYNKEVQEEASFECTEVKKVTKIVEAWEPV